MFIQGLSTGYIGPILLELLHPLNASLSEISRVFIGHAAGALFGSCGAVMLSDHHVWTAGGLVLLAVSIAVVPWCYSVTVLSGVFTVQGLATGLIHSSM